MADMICHKVYELLMSILNVVYIIITSVHQKFWINRINFSLENKSADVSIIFERLQKLCCIQNLVKNYWLRLRRNFLPDISKNLNILAQTRLYFSIWFLDKCLVV
jgi:hypothetical protein